MRGYCPPCLDVWFIRFFSGLSWENVWPGIRMHVACGRALHTIHRTPRRYLPLQ